MKKIFGILILLAAVGIPALAQRMSPDDQDKFNSYYSRWLQSRQTNDRDDMVGMEQRMQDLMAKYSIPSNTPYDAVASQAGYGAGDRDRDRNYDRGYVGAWQGRMSADDQKDFNKHYQKWQEAMAKNDREDVEENARKMENIMARYNIPPNTSFDTIATAGGYSRHYDYRDFRGKLSADDQHKFDKEYADWLKDRRKGESRNDIAKHEGKMQEIMARYNIPRDVPYDAIASGGRGY
jgi:hypothetical protein